MRVFAALSVFTFQIVLLSAASEDSCDPLRFDQPRNLGQVDSNDISEGSGLAASWRNSGVVWTHNDGPHDILYALRTDGHLLGKYHLNKSPDDVEDIAIGPGPADGASYLYAGDIGSNDSSRTKIKIYRAPEPEVSTSQESQKFDLDDVESFTLKYPDGSYDAEALLVDPIGRQIFVVTKEGGGAHVFRAGIDQLDPENSQTMELVAQIPFAKASGGTVSRDGKFVALRREDHAEAWFRSGAEDLSQTLQRASTVIPVVGPPDEPNGEGITFLTDDSGYMTLSEGENQPLYFFPRSPANGTLEFVGSPRVTSEGFEFQASACAGMNVALERSTDLRNWTQEMDFQANGSVQTLRAASGGTHAFYRLRAE